MENLAKIPIMQLQRFRLSAKTCIHAEKIILRVLRNIRKVNYMLSHPSKLVSQFLFTNLWAEMKRGK